MSTIDVVTWTGTAFSILGAAIAIGQAIRARGAAASAEQMRDEIAGKYGQSELSALDAVLSNACKAMDKYGPGSVPLGRRGSRPSDDAATVRAFTAGMVRHRELLAATFGSPCDDVRERINGLLNQFAAAQTEPDRTQFGAQVYQEITIFSGNMKSAVDTNVFGAPGAGEPRARLAFFSSVASAIAGAMSRPDGYRSR